MSVLLFLKDTICFLNLPCTLKLYQNLYFSSIQVTYAHRTALYNLKVWAVYPFLLAYNNRYTKHPDSAFYNLPPDPANKFTTIVFR